VAATGKKRAKGGGWQVAGGRWRVVVSEGWQAATAEAGEGRQRQ